MDGYQIAYKVKLRTAEKILFGAQYVLNFIIMNFNFFHINIC